MSDMKKFKSLLSLLFVMILMLQMVGPMAFAAGNNSFTLGATDPSYNPSTKQWESSWYIADVSGFSDIGGIYRLYGSGRCFRLQEI